MDDSLSLNNDEKEASEVLRSLLSLRRIDKPTENVNIIVGYDRGEGLERWQGESFSTKGRNFLLEKNQSVDGNPSADDKLEDISSTQIDSSPQVDSTGNVTDVPQKSVDTKKKKTSSVVRKNYNKVKYCNEVNELESSSAEVRRRFEMGCECTDDSCFRGLNPEAVYKHRLNIAELTKEEHDMYLMGVTMACMSDPVETAKRRQRQRLRSHYVYHGRRVCLQAFLYLENVTLYQLKRIRKHVTTHGVTPRIHGNHGKKPHNVFSLDIYRRATHFLKQFIQQHSFSSNNKGPIILPADMTRKAIHDLYRNYVQSVAPADEKVMGYSTFRQIMKEQFPLLRFSKSEIGSSGSGTRGITPVKQQRCEVVEDQTLYSGTQLKIKNLPIIIDDEEQPKFIVTSVEDLVTSEGVESTTISLVPELHILSSN